MTKKLNGKWYLGKGVQSDAGKWRGLPNIYPDALKDPAGYRGSDGLVAAVNVALELGMPLLLTGEPGCGKSRLADSLAWELGILDWDTAPGEDPSPRPLRFTVKSDTDSRDLFYRFDTLGRFHAAQVQRQGNTEPPRVVNSAETQTPPDEVDPRRFVTYHALGKAILYAHGRLGLETRYPGLLLPEQLKKIPQEPQRSVVLIDEIDKAPREVPNDLLNEIDDLSFEVPELFGRFDGKVALPRRDRSQDGKDYRPIVIITSNGERELPEAFLRRCVYYHVDLPPMFTSEGSSNTGDENTPVTIEAIVATRLSKRFSDDSPVRRDALAFFAYLRDDKAKSLKGKKPSLAELLNWLYFLGERAPNTSIRLHEHPDFRQSLSILLKHKDDLEPGALNRMLEDWSAKSR